MDKKEELEIVNSEINEIETRLKSNEKINVDELTNRFNELIEKRNSLKNEIEKEIKEERKAKEEVLNSENCKTIETNKKEERKGELKMDKDLIKSAFEKHLKGVELSEVEKRYVHKTTDEGMTVPTVVQNEVWDLVHQSTHEILDDINTIRSGVAMTIRTHTEIKKGKAKITDEAVANDDEENKFVAVTLSGKEFKKNVEISFTLAKMSNLLDYFVQEVARDLADALAKHVYDKIDDKTDSTAVTYNTNELTLAMLMENLGKIKGNYGRVKLYCSPTTYYKEVLGKLINQNQEHGAILESLKTQISLDSSIADGTIYLGQPKAFTLNIAQDLIIRRYTNDKSFTEGVSGLILAEGILVDPRAFVKLKHNG